MIMFEDISSEKRMKATMTRYMDPSVADQLLDSYREAMHKAHVFLQQNDIVSLPETESLAIIDG